MEKAIEHTQTVNEADGGAAAVERDVMRRVRVLPRPNRAVLFMRADGYAICPQCRGSGIEPTAATTVVEWCRNCKGQGKVRAS